MRGSSRRTFLLGAGAAVASGAALVAVGHSGLTGMTSVAGASTRRLAAVRFPPSGLRGDLAVAAVAASLENLAVFAYTAGLSAAAAGKLGTVPPAVATFATTVKGQHQQHAEAWNAVLKSHGKAPVTVTNPKLTPVVQSDFAKVTDVTGLAELALTLETIAAQTYQAETAKLKSSAAIAVVVFDPTGRDAAHRSPLLRTGQVPRSPDCRGHAVGLQPDEPGGLSDAEFPGRRFRGGAAGLVVAAALLLAACSSGGSGSGVRRSQYFGFVEFIGLGHTDLGHHDLELHVRPDGGQRGAGRHDQRHEQGLGHAHADSDRMGSSTPATSEPTRPRRSPRRPRPALTTTSATSTST